MTYTQAGLPHARPPARRMNTPRRLLYFQALENYLRSFQLLRGATPKEVRAHNHDFAERLDVCKAKGLKLPKEVEDYIRSPVRKKEYVRIRYDFRLDDQDTLDKMQRTMERLRGVVAEVEGTIGRAIEASNPDFIVLDGIKLTMIAGSATFKAWS
ncbi:hypothetical protein NKI94_07065 [Mesorhizobium australicum]|uniref:hypothetical protein n=1 Tax=Mesorhizobium australicum TaxID=536018 RepID=UPI00333A95E4